MTTETELAQTQKKQKYLLLVFLESTLDGVISSANGLLEDSYDEEDVLCLIANIRVSLESVKKHMWELY